MRQTASLGFLALGLVVGATTGCAGDAWLDASNPSGNFFFDPGLAREIRSFWYVSPSQVDAAAELLETQAVVAISPERAVQLIGGVPDLPTGESLYLIRAIDLADPKPIRVYQMGLWVQVAAATHSTCFVLRPPVRRQPIVVALAGTPTRLRLTYSCAGQ
jgi:hypothetical protein